MDFIFGNLKKSQNQEFFHKLQKSQKTWIQFFATEKSPKNMESIFATLKKTPKKHGFNCLQASKSCKNMDFIFFAT